MKMIVVAPALYKFKTGMTDDMPLMRAAGKWSWHHIDDITSILNSRDFGFPLTPDQVIQNFAPLCSLFENVPIVSVLVRNGTMYQITQQTASKFIQENINSARDYFIPAGWGMRILKVAKIGKIVKVVRHQEEGKHLCLHALDTNDEIIQELSLGDIPAFDPRAYSEP